MQFEMRRVDGLIPYQNNPRKNEHAVEKVADAIREFGFRVPVLITSDGGIVDGHLRYKAAIVVGMEEIPCMLADDMTEEQIRAFRISVNKLAELAKWDISLLKIELENLSHDFFDMTLLGFEQHELDDLLGEKNQDERDNDIPPIPKEPTSILRDLWILGDHRLLCGDATIHADHDRLCDGEVVDMICTDPPYNVDYKGKSGKIKNDAMPDGEFAIFLRLAMAGMTVNLKDGGAVYVTHADMGVTGIHFRQAFLQAGLHLAATIIWRKSQFVLGRSDYQFMHEPILYGWKEGSKHNWFGGRKKTTIFDFNTDNLVRVADDQYQLAIGDTVLVISGKDINVECFLSSLLTEAKPLVNDQHPTMKPVALFERFIKNSSRPGDIVSDSFGGSGTTMIACEKLGRKCRMMELDPIHVDLIIDRWQRYTGKTACHAECGRSFEQLRIDRKK